MLPLHRADRNRNEGKGIFPNVAIGPVMIRQTKAGPGDKSRAYLCSAFTAKLLCGLAIVGALVFAATVFTLNFEVDFARNTAEGEIRTSHKIERAARSKIVKVGSVLESYLLKESEEKRTAAAHKRSMNEAFDAFLRDKLMPGDKEIDPQLLKDWSEFRLNVIGEMNDFLETLMDDADDAKKTLVQVNRMLSDETFYPSRDRAASQDDDSTSNVEYITQRLKSVREKLGDAWGSSGRRWMPWAEGGSEGKDETKGDVSKFLGIDPTHAAIGRFFERFKILDTLVIPDASANALFALFQDFESWKLEASKTHDYDEFKAKMVEQERETWGKIRDLLKRDDGIQGIDMSVLDASSTRIQNFFNELRGVLLVKDHARDLATLHKLWKDQELKSDEVFQKLQELANLGEIPFEWVIGAQSAGDKAVKLERKLRRALEMAEKGRKIMPRKQASMARQIDAYLQLKSESVEFGWWKASQETLGSNRDTISELSKAFYEAYPNARKHDTRRRSGRGWARNIKKKRD